MSGGADQRSIVITTLAEYQTDFWLPVAQALIGMGRKVFMVAFDDRSADALEAAGISVARISGRPVKRDAAQSESRYAELLAAYGIDDPDFVFSHQRIAFQINDERVIRRTFLAYADGVEAAFEQAGLNGTNAVVVQELGGFLSVLVTLHAARRRGIDNWFIEPSFFRGRLSFQKNTLGAPKIAPRLAPVVSPEVARYLDETLERGAIVIPQKDAHQYRKVGAKVVNRRNLLRLIEKSVDKYILGKHQDFGHIGAYVRQHLSMLINAARSRPLYRPLESAGRFIYYPLHVPADMALTLRSPAYFDQLALVARLLEAAPPTHRVAIKEHPAQIGALPADRLRALAQKYPNLTILPPTTNNFAVLRQADAVVTVNSKSGAEAMLVGKPVIVLGDAFYADAPFVTKLERVEDLPAAIGSAIAAPPHDAAAVRRYFQSVHEATFPGELYVAEADNVITFAATLSAAIAQPQHAPAG